MAAARMPAAQRRTQLMDVAMRVFSREGYHGATMADVADAAGVTKPVLYQHFPSKSDLYRELLGGISDELAVTVRAAASAVQPGREQLLAGMTAYFEFVRDHRAEFRLLFGSGAQTIDEFAGAARDVEKSMSAAVADMIGPDIARGDATRLAHAVVGMAEAACRHWLATEPDRAPSEIARQMTDVLWHGLGSADR